MSLFATLNGINVNGHTEDKNGLTYLSWAWAWAEVKKIVPDAQYTIYERNTEFGPVNYFTDGRTCWVKTGVTLDGLEHIEELPVMDYKNKSIPLNAVTSMDVNKAIQRSLTKACARHGLGLYIYAGEDLPESDRDDAAPKETIPRTGSTEAAQEAGRRKLEEMNAARQPATDEQKQTLRGLVNLEQLDACNKMYGNDWGRMTANQCATMINRIQRAGASA